MSKERYQKETAWIIKDKYGGKTSEGLKNDLIKLKNGEPIDYIIGWKPFLGCKIDLSFKPLIPREETEFWAEKALLNIKSSLKKSIKVLDIFSGSGCVGVSILKNTKKTAVDFAEVNKKFVDQIKLNLKINKIKANRYKVARSNIFSNIKKKYDFILANPPYIPTTHINKIQKSVLKNEPHQALFGGKNGLKFIEHFLRQAKKYLNKKGEIWLEFDPSQKKEIEKIMKSGGYLTWSFKRDQHNRWRFVVIILE